MKYQINVIYSTEVFNTVSLPRIDWNHKSIYVLDTEHCDLSIEGNRKLWALVHLYKSFLNKDNKVFLTLDPDLNLDNVNSSRSPSHVQICKELLGGPSGLNSLTPSGLSRISDIDQELFMVYIPEAVYVSYRTREQSLLDKLFPVTKVRGAGSRC